MTSRSIRSLAGSTLTDTASDAVAGAPAKAARWLLIALTAMNLLNYIDRYIVTVLLPDIQRDLHMTDQDAGLLGTAFIVVYFLVSPVFGYVGDRYARPKWLAAGVGFWSIATAACATVTSAAAMYVGRGAVGVGEAAYGTIAPGMLADAYPAGRRGRTLSWFYLATPVGGALGYLLGGLLGKHLGWRHALLVVGIPGALLALAALRLKDPRRLDSANGNKSSFKEEVAGLLRNRLYVGTVAGYTAHTFALGGLAFWAPSYMIRVRGFEADKGMMYYGAITVVTGIVGTLLGGFLGDKLKIKHPKAYTWVNIASAVGGVIGVSVALALRDNGGFMACLTIAQVFLFLNMGPVNALIVGAVQPHMRASAMALSIFSIHLFGDAISPTLIGRISDAQGLEAGMRAIPFAFVVAGLIWASTLPRRRTS